MVASLGRFWQHTPPPAIQLKRIAQVLGIKAENVPERSVDFSKHDITEQDLNEFAAAGFGAMQGRPDDPMLDFLNLE